MVTGADKSASGVNSLEPVVVDLDASGHFQARVPGVRLKLWFFSKIILLLHLLLKK